MPRNIKNNKKTMMTAIDRFFFIIFCTFITSGSNNMTEKNAKTIGKDNGNNQKQKIKIATIPNMYKATFLDNKYDNVELLS